MTENRIIFLSGWANGRESLKPLAESLSFDGDFILTDPFMLTENPGASDADPASTFYRGLMDLMASAPQEKYILVGWSMGAMIALEAAYFSMDQILAVVAINACACFCRREDYPLGVPEDSLAAMMDNMHASPQSVLRAFFRRSSLPHRPSSDSINRRVRTALRFGTDPLIEGLCYLRDFDIRKYVPAIKIPMLVINSSYDKIVSPDAGAFLAALAPNAGSLLLPSGHDLPLTDPSLLTPAISEFLP